MTVFPDGREAPMSEHILPEDGTPEQIDAATKALLDQWTADLKFVTGKLAELEQSGDFAGKLNLDALGLMAAIQFCAVDSRCKAGLTMDPWMQPVQDSVIANGPAQPFLDMFSSGWTTAKNSDRFRQFLLGKHGDTIYFTIDGTQHYDFSDLPGLSPLAPALGLKGPLNEKEVFAIVSTVTTDFFDAALKGELHDLQAVISSFPENKLSFINN